ncbi:hypothetical protein GCM10027419_30480 [Pandoraea terrae]
MNVKGEGLDGRIERCALRERIEQRHRIEAAAQGHRDAQRALRYDGSRGIERRAQRCEHGATDNNAGLGGNAARAGIITMQRCRGGVTSRRLP